MTKFHYINFENTSMIILLYLNIYDTLSIPINYHLTRRRSARCCLILISVKIGPDSV